MTRDEAEAEIRRLIATEISAIRLSNELFTPGGLFGKLFSTPEEKKVVLNSQLFDQANRRLSELQLQEAALLKKSEKPVVVPTIGTAQIEQLIPSETASWIDNISISRNESENMFEREELERQIRELLSADIDSIGLSQRLFQQGTGLFALLGQSEEQRQEIVHSELWKLARARLNELERRDLERFREAVKVVERTQPPGSFLFRLESADQPK
jgi:hypothetical protein